MEKPSLEMIFGDYKAWEAKEGTWFISFMNGSQNMYLLQGEDKALLLDTGYGAGNLRAFVEKLTDKPILVANTHYHPDHAGGNGEFEEVFMSKGAILDSTSVESPHAVPFDLARLPFKDYKKTYLAEGDKIDLGGRVIEVLEAREAHCSSSLFFLDRRERMVFCGDDLESTQVIMFGNSKNPDLVYDLKERLLNMKYNLCRLKDLQDVYDWILPNHNGAPIAKSYIDDYIQLVDAVFDGSAIIEDKLNHPFIEKDPKAALLCRVRYKRASIFTKKKDVIEICKKGIKG